MIKIYGVHKDEKRFLTDTGLDTVYLLLDRVAFPYSFFIDIVNNNYYEYFTMHPSYRRIDTLNYSNGLSLYVTSIYRLV